MLNSLSRRLLLSIAAILLVAGVVCADEPVVSGVQLADLDGIQVEPFQAKDAKAIVFIFLRTDCPISNRYAPEVRRLHEKFAKSGLKFWLVYPDASESVVVIRKHINEYEYRLSALRDPQHKLVKMTGVQVTPEAAVFSPSGRMVYRGRIDDKYVALDKVRPAPNTHELEQVLEAILEGKHVTSTVTLAIGCFIPDL